MTALDEWFSLEGKVALITGAGSGLGRAIAFGLAEVGADIVAWGRSQESVDLTSDGVRKMGRRAAALATDVGSSRQVKESVARTLEVFRKIHILVNNAGILMGGPSQNVPEEEWDKVLHINLTGTFLCSRAVGTHMIETGGGKIINVGSIFGLMGTSHSLAYSCSKAAIHQMTRSLAVEWARYHITVNAILPGHFETDMSSKVLSDPELSKRVYQRMPIRRAGRPEELKPLVVYLASASSDYVTGQAFCIDGGYSIAMPY